MNTDKHLFIIIAESKRTRDEITSALERGPFRSVRVGERQPPPRALPPGPEACFLIVRSTRDIEGFQLASKLKQFATHTTTITVTP